MTKPPQKGSQKGKARPRRKRGPQWTVHGVSHETRTAVSMAAKRAGMSVGDWVEAALRTAATREIKGERNGKLPVRLEDVVSALEKVSDRQREQGKVQTRILEQLAETTIELNQSQQERFESLARQDTDQAKALLAIAEKLDQKIEIANKGRDEALKALVERLNGSAAPRRGLFERLLGRG